MPDPEDVHADITGDPPAPPPMSQKQVAGAQKAQVNRTQLPSGGPHPAGKGMSPGDGKPDGAMPPDKVPPVTPDTPVLGGAEALINAGEQGSMGAADQQLQFDPRNFNPLNGADWLKEAASSPLSTYHLGRHVWDAYFGAFLDGGAISYSIQNIQAQDDALTVAGKNNAGRGRMGGAATQQDAQQQKQDAQARLTGGEQQIKGAADTAATALTIGANPWNMLPFGQARGAAMLAMMMTPTIATAILGKGDPNSELLWGGAAAILFGGKLPPSVESHLAENAPQALKLFDKIGATQRVIDKGKIAAQDRQALLNKVLAQAQPEKNVVLAPAWDSSMVGKGKEWEQNMSKKLVADYGTLDRNTIVEKMYAAGAPQAEINSVHTYLMKMPEPLMYFEPAEEALVNPVSHLSMLPADARAEVEKGHHWALHMINQAEIGPAGNAGAPEASHWRSLIGVQDTNTLVGKQYETHLLNMAGAEATNPAEQDLLQLALEGDRVAYQKLSPQMKVVRDEMRMVRAGLRLAAKDSEFSTDSLNNYAPHVHVTVKDGKGVKVTGSGALLSQQAQRHRVLTLDEEGRVVQKYPTAQAAQAAVVRLQKTISGGIIAGTPIHELTGVPETDYERIEGIRSIADSYPEIAQAEAEAYAKEIAPDISTNPFDGIAHDIEYLKSISAYRAVTNLLNTIGRDGRSIAVKRPVNDKRAFDALLRQGYAPINARGFHEVLVGGEYGKLLARATRGGERKGLKEAIKTLDPKALSDIEGKAVAAIMYSPRIHGMNMAFRLGVLGTMHLFDGGLLSFLHGGGVGEWMQAGLIQGVGRTHVGAEAYRMEAWNARVIPPEPGTSQWADRMANTLGDHTGDADLGQTPILRDLSGSAAKDSSGARLVLGKAKDLLWGKQSDLWSWVSDFGVMAYHLELEAAKNSGRFPSEAEASAYAARRANSWMGHVAPEDTNPALHAIAKTVTFAPNYWRSYAELLTGIYNRAGWGWSKDTIAYVVKNEIKTALAAVAFQQLSANALNIMLSGHTIYQNDPGNWGKVEITSPWAVAALDHLNLGIDPKTGRNAKGQKLTMENPVARQMTDTEEALGLLTSSPHWDPATLAQGSRAFAAGRISPVVSALGALANIDVYSSIASGSPRYMDPNTDGQTNPLGNPALDAFSAAASLTPFSYISNQIQQSMLAGQDPTQDMPGPYGTKIPKVVADTIKGLPADALRSFLIGMTGVNPPYERSSKTFGIEPTDDQYKSVHEIQDTYAQNMNALSTSALTGQMTPYTWIAAYRQLSTKRADEFQAIFKHAPEYNDGPLGLVNSWEGLYDQASKDGIVDPDALRTLQRSWRNSHSAADYAATQSELRSSDQKYPMLSLYHKTLDAYDNWQFDYAKQNGVDLETLRSDLNGYSKAYGDRNATNAWLLAHPDIQPYENAKKSQFENGSSHYGEAGLMFALFFSPTAGDGYLLSSGQTTQQVEAATWDEQVPPAP